MKENLELGMSSIIPESVKDIQKIFTQSGKRLYVVGGAVRDFLKGENPKDFDLCTDATPDEILEIIGDKYKTNLQGSAFGVVVIYTDDQPGGMEIATFRSDKYDGKSRNPEVQFTTIEKDVDRRDLTINSLFYDLESGEIVDLVGGVRDLKEGIVRMVGDPIKRIEEDPLRILRVARFAHRYGYKIDKSTSDALKKTKSQLSRITRERIWEEIKKSFGYGLDFGNYIQILSDHDLLEEIFPDLNINSDFTDSVYLEVHFANILKDNDPDKLESKMILQLKIESAVSSKVCHLIRLIGLNPDNAFRLYKDKVKNHVNDDMIGDWFRFANIDNSLKNAFVKYRPSVSAESLIKLGYKGAELGKMISKMESEEFEKLLDK
jgi:tRNA nucleotidyltransferase/poly(A) polymerase